MKKKTWPIFPLVQLVCSKCGQPFKGIAKKIDSKAVWTCGCEPLGRRKKRHTKKILDKT